MTSLPHTVGFVGGGRIVRCMVGGWRAAGTLPERILVSEPDAEAFARLSAIAPSVQAVPLDQVATSGTVVLALHPPVLRSLLGSGGLRASRGTVLLSLAPGLTLPELEDALSTCRLARAIPNAPSLVGHGFNPVAFAPGFPKEEQQAVLGLLDPLGECPEVEEETLEAWAVLTGMGPTYLRPLLQALRECGRSLGPDPAEVDRGLQTMTHGAVSLLLQSGVREEEVMGLVPAKPLETLIQPVAAEIPRRLEAVYRKLHPAQ